MKIKTVVEDPRQIRQISEKVLEKAAEDSLTNLYVGLEHNHSSIVRGAGEDSRGLNEYEFATEYPVEIIRTDGGESWVHSPESRCYERVRRIGRENTKKHIDWMKEWGEEGVDELEEFLEEDSRLNPVYDSGDIYDANTGRQIAGLSMETKGDYALMRMCFYDGNEHGELFHELINYDRFLADENEDLKLEDPRDSIIEIPGFYDHLMQGSIEGSFDYSELETGTPDRDARPPTYCVGPRT